MNLLQNWDNYGLPQNIPFSLKSHPTRRIQNEQKIITIIERIRFHGM